ASQEHPLRLYYGDFSQSGTVEMIEAEFDPTLNAYAPRRNLEAVSSAIPALREQFSSFKQWSETTMDQVLAKLVGKALKLEARTLTSMVFLNRKDHFVPIELPPQAQWSPAFAVTVADF